MSAQRVASRYAKALVDIAVEQGQLEQVNEDIQSFLTVMKNRDFELLVKSPIVNTDKKANIFDAIFGGKISEITDKFFKIVLRKNRESYLPHIASAFVEQYKIIKHISTVTITSAKKLSDSALNAIKDKLAASGSFSENIEFNTKVDESLIGGFRLEFGDKLYDASVAYKLEQLKKEFKNNNYIKKI
jgi:F-type H+-transporting ATPase subunit delta